MGDGKTGCYCNMKKATQFINIFVALCLIGFGCYAYYNIDFEGKKNLP